MTRICKILVVEDDDAVRLLLGEVLQQEGYEFALVRSGAEMRLSLDAGEYDIVIIDISLRGGEDGVALAEVARERGCGVILTTGDPAQMTRARASQWRSLMKPFRIRPLLALVDSILQETEAQCERRTGTDGPRFPASA
jgi:DNA-binding response OmpR family regulator